MERFVRAISISISFALAGCAADAAPPVGTRRDGGLDAAPDPVGDAGARLDADPGDAAPQDASAVDAGSLSDAAASRCRSDRECSTAAQICDERSGRCVDCVSDGDCGAEQVCLAFRCEARVPCTSSRMCPGLVCDVARGYCVECVTDVDCGEALRCSGGSCVDPPPACTSDRDCSALGLVCADGYCAECASDGDCPADRFCDAEHMCAPDVCEPGERSCSSESAIAVCASNGGRLEVVACGATERCADGECSEVLRDGGMTQPDAGNDAGGIGCRPPGSCDLVRQDCGGGNACYFDGTASYCAATGLGSDGSSCTTDANCRAGFGCGDGACRRYCCEGDTSACLPGQRCIGLGGPWAGECRAPDSCVLVAPQSGCASGQGCYLAAESGTRHCFSSGTLEENAGCGFLNDCAPGSQCIETESGDYRCFRYCQSTADCRSGQSCAELGVGDARVCSPAMAPICEVVEVAEDFEDIADGGRPAGWLDGCFGGSSYSWSVWADTPASSILEIDFSGGGGEAAVGVPVSWPTSGRSTVSFWIWPGTDDQNVYVLPVRGNQRLVDAVPFQRTGRVGTPGGPTYTAGSWYQVEYEIDFDASVVSVSVNDTLVFSSAFAPSGLPCSLAGGDYFSFHGGFVDQKWLAYIDDLTIVHFPATCE